MESEEETNNAPASSTAAENSAPTAASASQAPAAPTSTVKSIQLAIAGQDASGAAKAWKITLHDVDKVVQTAEQLGVPVVKLLGHPAIASAIDEILHLADHALNAYDDAAAIEITPDTVAALKAADTPLAAPSK